MEQPQRDPESSAERQAPEAISEREQAAELAEAAAESPTWLQRLRQSQLFRLLVLGTFLFWGKPPDVAHAAPVTPPPPPEGGAVSLRDGRAAPLERLSEELARIRSRFQEARVSSEKELEGLADRYGVEVYTRFYTKDDNGEWRFNWDSLVAPVGLGFHEVEAKQDLVRVMIPYRYAVLFNKAELLDEADRAKVETYVKSELTRQMVESQLQGLDWRPEAWRASREGGEWNIGATSAPATERITNVKLVGTASPEGPAAKGPGTLAIDAIDSENLALGELRARNLQPTVSKALNEVLDNPELFQQAVSKMKVQAKELQFSERELTELETMARELGYQGEGLEKVFRLIVDYNDNTLTNSEIVRALDDYVGAKRMVILSFTRESGRIDTFLIPLPLIALLGLVRRRRSAPTDGTPPPAEPAPTAPPQAPADVAERFRQVEGRDHALRQSDPAYEAWRTTVRPQTIENDLLANWDNPDVRARGLNYDQICGEFAAQAAAFPSREARLDALTYRLLQDWRAHDLAARQAAGVEDETGLEYLADERQILWARVHAEVLDEAMTAKQADDRLRVHDPNAPTHSYRDFVEQLVR